MSDIPRVSLAAAQAQAAALAALCNGGFLDLYAAPQPSTPENAPGPTALVSIALPDPFAASVAGGVIVSNTILPAGAALEGVAAWCRVWRPDHTTAVFDGSVDDVPGAVVVLNSTLIAAGALIDISSFTFTIPGV